VTPPQNIYIKAMMTDSTTFVMAEAAALALVAAVTHQLYLPHTYFLSDNQELVHFLNASYHSNALDWRIKHFTRQSSIRIFKIQRAKTKWQIH
jgi:hypothetical protein